MVVVCSENEVNFGMPALRKQPTSRKISNRVVGIVGWSSPKAIICSIFFIVKVKCCGVLIVSVQSLLTTIES